MWGVSHREGMLAGGAVFGEAGSEPPSPLVKGSGESY